MIMIVTSYYLISFTNSFIYLTSNYSECWGRSLKGRDCQLDVSWTQVIGGSSRPPTLGRGVPLIFLAPRGCSKDSVLR